MEKEHYIIGISGGSGSGKTTFVENLKMHLKDKEVCFISLDNYYLPREKQLTDSKGVKNFDLPQSIKADELVQDIKMLKQGKTVTKTEYVFNNASAIPSEIQIIPSKLMIIEGLFIYHYPELKDLFDLKLYIHAKENLKLIRRIKRDQTERNYPVEDVIYRYEHHVMPAYEKYIKAYREDVDIIINNNTNLDKGLDVVLRFIESKLSD